MNLASRTRSFARFISRCAVAAGPALLAATAVAATGCSFKVEGETQETTKFEGTPKSQKVTYGANQNLRIDCSNGALSVETNDGNEVIVEFRPFAIITGNDEAAAEAEAQKIMNENVKLKVAAEGDLITIQALRDGSGSFGADVIVSIPRSFSGNFITRQGNGPTDINLAGSDFDDALDVASDNGSIAIALDGTAPTLTRVVDTGAGDISVTGAAGRLEISGDFDVAVHVASWSGEDGFVKSDDQLGEVALDIPANANGRVVAVAPQITAPSPLPAGWEAAANPQGGTAFTLGTGEGGTVTVTAAEAATLRAH